MKRQTIALAVLMAVAAVAAFVAGAAVAGDDGPGPVGPAMTVGRSSHAPDWWGDQRGPATGRWPGSMMEDPCPGWSVHRSTPAVGRHRWMMGHWSDPDR